jgi:hypothetical protein
MALARILHNKLHDVETAWAPTAVAAHGVKPPGAPAQLSP